MLIQVDLDQLVIHQTETPEIVRVAFYRPDGVPVSKSTVQNNEAHNALPTTTTSI